MNTSLTQTALDGMVVGNIFDTVNDLTSEAMIALKAVIVLFGVVGFLIGAVAAKGKTAGTIMAGIGGARQHRRGGHAHRLQHAAGQQQRFLAVGAEHLFDHRIHRRGHALQAAADQDRRAFIEEAAGVLKHRKRKEKAVRKLDAMQANLARLTDLTAELRRQLKPLGRQAEVARRAQTVQADLRDARLRLAADDLVTRRGELATQQGHEEMVREQFELVQAALEVATAELAEQERAVAALTPRIAPPIEPPMAAPAAPRMRVAMSGSQRCGKRKTKAMRRRQDGVSGSSITPSRS